MPSALRSVLIATKLHRPPVTGDFIARPRLVELLNRGLDDPLTLVCAPAGFGKTTLVSAWIADAAPGQDGIAPALPAAWLSLDESDSDPVLFLRYFIAALHTIFPGACAAALDLLRAPAQPPAGLILAEFVNELAALPQRTVMVLDDFQVIRGEAVPNLLKGLIRHWPAPLRLVLIARSNPPLPLANLRAKGQVTEIRGRDLRFTPEEVGAFLETALPGPLSAATVALLEQRTEGWIAGLRLAMLSLAAGGDAEASMQNLARADADIADYLVDEVLAHQPPKIQKFLLITSLLDRFSVPLCEAVAGGAVAGGAVAGGDPQCDVRACMAWLERANLFVTPLDDQHEWLRYHHLFQELLRRRLNAFLPPAEISDLHCRAAEWLAPHGFVDEALRHALAAGDLDLAARLMEAGLCDVLNREDRPTLERWLRLLPEGFIQGRPGLLMLKAWVLQLSWQLDALWRLIQQVEALLADEGDHPPTGDVRQVLRGQLQVFQGQAAYFRNETAAAVAHCSEALSLLPPSWMYARGAVSVYLGLAMQASGQGRAAELLLRERYEALSDKTTNYGQRLLMALCFVYLQEGQLEAVRRTAQVMLRQATQGELMIVRCWAHYLLGVTNYQQNELAVARGHFAAVIENRYVTQALTVSGSFFGLVLTQQALGELGEACRTLDLLSQSDLQAKGAEDERTRSLRARLALLLGDLEGAARWADTAVSQPPDRPLLWLEEPHLTKARILLARGAGDDVQAALRILDMLLALARNSFNTRFQIEILALRAVALEMQGRDNDALADLRQAVEFARPGGVIRVFADCGPRLRTLLLRSGGQGFAVETIRRILAAFPVAPEVGKTATVVSGMRVANAGLIEPLSRRELEVLGLLRERLSNKEIADKLSLSTVTVKRHTVNLYGKLGVNRRWDAVLTAESLGILPRR